MTACKHERLKETVYEGMGEPFHSATCPDCHTTVAIRWISSWSGNSRPSEQIMERAEEIMRDFEEDNRYVPSERREELRPTELECWKMAVGEYLDSQAGFPKDKC